MRLWVPISLRYLLSVYGAGVLFFLLFRVVLLVVHTGQLQGVPAGVVARALFNGWRFDTVISGYILILPAVVLLLSELLFSFRREVLLVMHLLLCVLYSVCFLACAADIPYFNNYNSRLNISILSWTDSPLFMAKMVWEDTVFLCYFGLFVVAVAAFCLVMAMIYKRFKKPPVEKKTFRTRLAPGTLALMLTTGLLILGIRGRTDEKSPIMPGTAYFSIYDLPNQAGLNPVFTLMWSYLEGLKDENKRIALADDKESLQLVQSALGASSDIKAAFPIQRHVAGTQPQHNYNVVVVLMESMSAYYMQRYGDKRHLTPNLDSLADRGYSFNNFYSAGIHTYNGIFSSLYGFPALMARHTMLGATIGRFTGLPYLLKSRGYNTVYFTTHDDQFDNVGGFLTGNHFARVVSKPDYDPAEVVSTLGVSDHSMFRYSFSLLNECCRQREPFLAVYMTTSNHNPFVIPKSIPFKAAHEEVRGGCVEYADWAIGDFMKRAASMPWYSNTIFVFAGDHGAYEGSPYGSLPLGYSRIPCIIYSPLLGGHRDVNAPGGQIDIFPTVAGLLGGNYVNNTMGIDMLHESRPWMFFSQDDKVAVADTSDVFIWQTDGTEHLYNIAKIEEIISLRRGKADSMKKYAFSMIQSYQWLLDKKATGW
jgi:phosphoglycerol transferase MdoB-like AlkP superfamily enzyme